MVHCFSVRAMQSYCPMRPHKQQNAFPSCRGAEQLPMLYFASYLMQCQVLVEYDERAEIS
jgi:hypothetical protein